ncbi:MAG TPA: hypothetical protein VGK14_02150 [Novimethylophilus sp.]|jgi:hypothetical protein|uniref:hypothetical protein n=1 Tax=Novimethylophilus sp. TaxID=2137426 RepID=UPI002F4176A3
MTALSAGGNGLGAAAWLLLKMDNSKWMESPKNVGEWGTAKFSLILRQKYDGHTA